VIHDLQLILAGHLPSSDIKDGTKDEEQPVTAEMMKQRKLEQEALEKKRKEEISIKSQKAAATEIKEGQIAVESIESESSSRSEK